MAASLADTLTMHKATTYWVVGTAIVVFGVALEQGVFTRATRVPHQLTETSVGARSSSSEVPHSVDHTSPQSEKALSANIHQAGPAFDPKVSPAVSAQPTDGNKPKTPASAQVGVDASVIGSPFPISASVEAACRGFVVCDETREMLSKMAQEPRDSAWATEMEMKIQENVLSQGPDKYTIRDIECRSSLCAVETASSFGLYFGPGYPDPLDRSLHAMVPIWGYETDPSGVRVTVTLKILKRR